MRSEPEPEQPPWMRTVSDRKRRSSLSRLLVLGDGSRGKRLNESIGQKACSEKIKREGEAM